MAATCTNDRVWTLCYRGAKQLLIGSPATLGSFPSTCWYTSLATYRPQQSALSANCTTQQNLKHHSTLFAKTALPCT